MANAFNDWARTYELDTADIISFNPHTDPEKLRPICIRRIELRPNATGDGVQFTTVNPSSDPTLTLTGDTFTVTSTYRISDDAGAALTQASCAVGNWVNVSASSSGNNLGWYYISANDGSNVYIDVAYGTNALTNEANQVYTLKIYTPETAMIMISETGDTGAKSIKTQVIDWGEKGRWFQTLAMHALSTSANVMIHLA